MKHYNLEYLDKLFWKNIYREKCYISYIPEQENNLAAYNIINIEHGNILSSSD